MKSYFIFCFLLIAMFLSITSCSSDSDDVLNGEATISDALLTGKLNGQDFTISGGMDIGTGTNELSLVITNYVLDCQTTTYVNESRITLDVPTIVGTYTNMDVVYWADSQSGKMGVGSTVIISSTTDTEITGKIKNTLDADNFVEGSFAISLCQ